MRDCYDMCERHTEIGLQVIQDKKSGQYFEQIKIRIYSSSSGQRKIIPLDLANHIIVRKSTDVALILIPKNEMERFIGFCFYLSYSFSSIQSLFK